MKPLKYLPLLALLALAAACSRDGGDEPNPPGPETPSALTLPRKELRGVWVTTAWGLDWPMDDYNTATQKQKYLDYLDLLAANKMNALFFQVRSMADAFYDSAYEPWSKYITGTAGTAPGYDVLGFLVDEAHKRGIQFHAWLNPYRIATRAKGGTFPALDAKIPAALTKDYEAIRIYNPALPEVQTRITQIVREIITRYPVDGIHLDDYFYPALGTGESMNDAAEYDKYGKATFGNIDDFRRNNVNQVIQNIQKTIIDTRPGVIFSVSPAANLDNNYSVLFADVKKWMKEGWVDVVIPQLYFATGTDANSFNTRLDQWVQYLGTAHCLIGYGIYKFGDAQYGSVFQSPDDLRRQFDLAGRKSKVEGSVLYSAKSLTTNKVGITTTVGDLYKKPVLMPYLGRTAAQLPAAPANVVGTGSTLSWSAVPDAYYAVYKSNGEGKLADLVGTTRETSFTLPARGTYCVTALSKAHAESRISQLVTY